MPTVFSKPEPLDPIPQLVIGLMNKWHQELSKAGVKVGVILAANPDGVAVTHGGYPAMATMKIVSLKDRLVKGYDAELLIDEREWEDLTDESRAALIDHELCHLDLVTKEDPISGNMILQRDDLGRPKLRTRKGDWNVGDGFRDVVFRHGDDAVEFENIRRAFARANLAKRGEE